MTTYGVTGATGRPGRNVLEEWPGTGERQHKTLIDGALMQ